MHLERIRRARTDDAEALTRLSVAATRTHGYDAAGMISFLAVKAADIDAGLTFVAERGEDTLVGVVGLHATNLPGLVILDRLFVDPAAQRGGIGRRLLATAARTAAAMNASTILVYAHPGAVAFYTRLGAIPVGATPLPQWPGLMLEMMAYRLDREPG